MVVNQQEIDVAQASYYDTFGELPPMPFGMPDDAIISAIENAIKSSTKIGPDFEFNEQFEENLRF